jgi:stage II sporulation protein D
MTSLCNFIRILSIIFLLPQFLSASSWPLVVTSNDNLFSTKKYTVRSSKNLNINIKQDQMQYLFSDPSLCEDLNIQAESLDDFFDRAHQGPCLKVRVLLAKTENEVATEWKYLSPRGFVIYLKDDAGKIKKTIKVKTSVVTIKIKREILLCNGKRMTGVVCIRPLSGHGEFNGTAYDGDFTIMNHKNSFLCINNVDLEDYISAVLRTESWPGWPLEVNKAFAITSRSYVVFKALEAQRSGRPFDVKNSNAHQTYRGKHDIVLLKKAVAHTRGMVLGFAGKPILAMFDCCCGGVIPAHVANFDFAKVPYLARTYACFYCKQSSLYSWTVSYNRHAFEALLRKHYPNIKQLSDIRVIKKDKAGLALEVRVKGSKEMQIISGKELYSLLKEVKSFYFDVSKKADTIIFLGRGFGHHLGLCQWGARQMVREGWDYKSIVRFYYPGTYFMHLM